MGIVDWLGTKVVAVSDKVQNALPPRCPIPWRPNVFAPVFHGHRDLVATRPDINTLRAFGGESAWAEFGSPVPLRVVFPSLGGTPRYNEILGPCGEYPLVVFAHGDCSSGGPGVEDQLYLAWSESRILVQLARAGYVVAVPQLPADAPGADVGVLEEVVAWMYTRWEHARLLAPPPKLAVIGHSFGGATAASYAGRFAVAAVVGLSPAYSDWAGVEPRAMDIVTSQRAPKLYVYAGTAEDGIHKPDGSWYPAPDGSRSEGTWQHLPGPKHELVADAAEHYDYLPGGSCAGVEDAGPCRLFSGVVADVVTMFLGRYLHPPAVPRASVHVPASLRVPASWDGNLSLKQLFYAGAYLQAMRQMDDATEECAMTLTYELQSSSGVTHWPN